SGTRARLLLGWIIATLGGIGGLYWSFYSDLPSGAAIVCTFGVLLVIVSTVGLLKKARASRRSVQGSARVPRVWRGRPRHRELLFRCQKAKKACFGVTPKPTRETRALPGRGIHSPVYIPNPILNRSRIHPHGIRLGAGIGIRLDFNRARLPLPRWTSFLRRIRCRHGGREIWHAALFI